MKDRFVSQKPQFTPPNSKYEELTKPPERNTLPAQSIKEQKHSHKVQELLQQAKQLSKGFIPKYIVASQNSKYRETLKETKKFKAVSYCQAHIIEDDAEFVSIVRNMTIESKGAKNLFFANGGQQYVDAGLTLAQGWDLLRNDRMKRLLPTPGKDSDKRQYSIGKGYVPGSVSDEDRWRKVLQMAVKHNEQD